jgi:hypothetical protein
VRADLRWGKGKIEGPYPVLIDLQLVAIGSDSSTVPNGKKDEAAGTLTYLLTSRCVPKSKWHKHCLDAIRPLTQFSDEASLCANHAVVGANSGQDEVVAWPAYHLIDRSRKRIKATAE